MIATFKGYKQIVEILLEKGNPNVDLPNKVFLLFVPFSFFFTFSFFYFFYLKDGITPLYIAAREGNKQIVEILLEKGNPNVDLPDKVLIILKFGFVDLVSFFFFLFLFSFLFSHFSFD